MSDQTSDSSVQVDIDWTGRVNDVEDYEQALIPEVGPGPGFVLVDHVENGNCVRVNIRSNGPRDEASLADYLEFMVRAIRASVEPTEDV